MVIREGSVQILTFKDGLLARLAHDLQLTLIRFEVRIDALQVSATFWPETLSVDGAVREGRVDPKELSDSDKQKIQKNIQGEVLHTSVNPQVTFSGSGTSSGSDHLLVRGQLALNGRTQPLEIDVRTENGRYRGEVSLTPSRWGIAPYKALAGAIKLQDRVLVRFDLPASSS